MLVSPVRVPMGEQAGAPVPVRPLQGWNLVETALVAEEETMTDLMLRDVVPEGPPALWPPPTPATVATRDDAEDAGKALALADAQLAVLDGGFDEIKRRYQQARREIETAKAWLEGRYLAALGTWADKNRDKGKKSVALMSGVGKFRASKDTVKWLDDGKVIAWALENAEECVKMAPRLDVSKVKDILLDGIKATGEVPEGVEYVPGTENFSFKVAVEKALKAPEE